MIMVLNNAFDKNSLELLGKARELADKVNCAVIFFLITDKEENFEKAGGYGADKVIAIVHPQLGRFSLDPFLKISERIVRRYSPSIIISPATTFGRTLLPALAAKLKTGLTADCTGLDIDDEGNLLQTRPAIGGNVMATIKTPNHRPQMATVRPKTFPIPKYDSSKKAKVIIEKPNDEDLKDRCYLLDFKEKEMEANVQEADVVVSVGKGLRRRENVEIARKLAKLVKGAVGATRAVVDAKWLTQDHQIGLSGKVVKPKIYIAAGISGAVQHIAGMQTSEFVVAINKDKYAPIFKVADIGLVADAASTLEEIIKKLESLKEAKS